MNRQKNFDRIRLLTAFLSCVAWAQTSRDLQAGDAATLPFSVTLGKPFRFAGLPRLHSYAYGHANVGGDTKWLLVTGRKNGLHGFAVPAGGDPDNNFVAAGVNDRLCVLDIEGRQAWSTPLGSLPHVLTDPLRASNAVFCQDADDLYVMGGYGATLAADTTGRMLTFNTLTVLKLSPVIESVIAGRPYGGHVTQMCDDRLRITGGGLLKLGNSFVAVFGQRFDGLYSPNRTGGVFEQAYLEHVVEFEFTRAPRLGIFRSDTYTGALATKPYHRRDLTVAPIVLAGGRERIAAYGGVFCPDRPFSAHLSPVYIETLEETTKTFAPGVDGGFEQLTNQYECAKLCMYDARDETMYTTLFGGISQYRYDRDAHQLIKDELDSDDGVPVVDGMPFTKVISTIVRFRNGRTVQRILPVQMPGFLGTGAHLLLDPTLPQFDNGVIKLDELRGPTLVGYFFGGIESQAPYSRRSDVEPATDAYDQLIPITITPGTADVLAMPAKPEGESCQAVGADGTD